MKALRRPAAKSLRTAALAYPQTVEDFPWGERAFKVGGKKAFLFLYEREDGGFNCTMKLPFRAEEALTLKGAEPAGYGLGRAGWVTFKFTAKAKAPMAELIDYLDESWRAVAPKKMHAAVAPPTAKSRRRD